MDTYQGEQRYILSQHVVNGWPLYWVVDSDHDRDDQSRSLGIVYAAGDYQSADEYCMWLNDNEDEPAPIPYPDSDFAE